MVTVRYEAHNHAVRGVARTGREMEIQLIRLPVEFRQQPHLCSSPCIVQIMVIDHRMAVGALHETVPSSWYLIVIVAVEVLAIRDRSDGGRDEPVGLTGIATCRVDEVDVVVAFRRETRESQRAGIGVGQGSCAGSEACGPPFVLPVGTEGIHTPCDDFAGVSYIRRHSVGLRWEGLTCDEQVVDVVYMPTVCTTRTDGKPCG